MTTSIKIRTNGNYVAEARSTSSGALLASAGPGSNVESEWTHVPHEGFVVSERNATEEEIVAANLKLQEKDDNGGSD